MFYDTWIIIHTKLGLLTNKKERLRKKRKTKNQLFWWDFGRKGQVGWEMKSQEEEEEKWVQSLWWSWDKFSFLNYPREPLWGGGGVSHTPDLITLCCGEGAWDKVEEGYDKDKQFDSMENMWDGHEHSCSSRVDMNNITPILHQVCWPSCFLKIGGFGLGFWGPLQIWLCRLQQRWH